MDALSMGETPPDTSLNLYFSNASEQLDSNSLRNTSLSVYIDFATISSSFLVSALNSLFSVSIIIGSSTSKGLEDA
jgi:hypothetical protein